VLQRALYNNVMNIRVMHTDDYEAVYYWQETTDVGATSIIPPFTLITANAVSAPVWLVLH